MSDWPAAPFPQVPLVEGYDEAAPSTTVRTKMDAGPPKVRRRYTAGVRNFGIMLDLTLAQVETLDAFYVTTLHGGDEVTHSLPAAIASVCYRDSGTG